MNSHHNKLTIVIVGILLMDNIGCSRSYYNEGVKSDSSLFYSLVTRYTEAVNQADTALASKIWAHTGEVSFINPRGHEYRWNGIKNIYMFFKDNFTERKLSFHNLKYANYGKAAWLEFYWEFVAIVKENNNPVQTKGRETQIWRKINNEWRLVHVHYSDMPVAH